MQTENLTPEEKVVFYELEKVRFIMKDATGLDVGYAVEDLVFSEHGIYIIQFNGEDPNTLLCYFNHEFDDSKRVTFMERLVKSAQLNGIGIEYKGKFEMSQEEGAEQISLRFF